MTHNVWMGTLNPTHSLILPRNGMWFLLNTWWHKECACVVIRSNDNCYMARMDRKPWRLVYWDRLLYCVSEWQCQRWNASCVTIRGMAETARTSTSARGWRVLNNLKLPNLTHSLSVLSAIFQVDLG